MSLKLSRFSKSIVSFEALPDDKLTEVAFAGRSNAGKSSALNSLTGIKNLAKTSKTPGRTQAINFFEVLPYKYLVDLPGYGYAKVPATLKKKWEALLQRYLLERQSLKGLCLIMDIRHPFRPMDHLLLEACHHRALPVHVLLTKSDKYSRGQALNLLQSSLSTLKKYNAADFSCQLFSSIPHKHLKDSKENKKYLDTARLKISQWLFL